MHGRNLSLITKEDEVIYKKKIQISGNIYCPFVF